MKFIVNMQTRFIKSFSNGQITIPREFRDQLGVGTDFWLKMSIQGGKLVAELAESAGDRAGFRKMLLSLGTVDINESEIERNRKQWEKQAKDRAI